MASVSADGHSLPCAGPGREPKDGEDTERQSGSVKPYERMPLVGIGVLQLLEMPRNVRGAVKAATRASAKPVIEPSIQPPPAVRSTIASGSTTTREMGPCWSSTAWLDLALMMCLNPNTAGAAARRPLPLPRSVQVPAPRSA